MTSLNSGALRSIDQFRPAPPPALDSAAYAAAVNETRSNVADAARLMAMVYVSFADALSACFDAKYHYNAWRPVSAVNMADADGNGATQADAAWTPVLPTPNHPEYPAAHSRTSGSLGEALRSYYGTSSVTFTWDSKVTGTTRSFTSTEAFNEENRYARIHGGIHFGFSTNAGAEHGKRVAQWVPTRHFGRQD